MATGTRPRIQTGTYQGDCLGRVTGERFFPLRLTRREMADWERTLEKLCGDAPRRISNEMAIASTMPIAMTSCFIINTPVLDDGETETGGITTWHYRELEDTICEGALSVSDNTWVSTPERALLDCGEYSRYYQTVKLVLQSLAAKPLNADSMIETAEIIGNYKALRRVCSISTFLHPEETNADWMRPVADYAEQLDQTPIYLCGEEAPIGPKIFWQDDRFGVMWDIPPKSVFADVYYY